MILTIFLILGQFADPNELFQFVVENFDGGKRFHCGLCNKFEIKTKWSNGFYIQFRQHFTKETFSYDEHLKS